MTDDALGAEYAQLKQQGGYTEAGLVESPDIAAIASGFGADGHTVRTPADLEAVEAALSTPPNGPVVVDCSIDRTVIHRRFQ
jgi:thiamine pyrophosphate-dependent acetolactate synthase large subunit-like protein